MKIGFVGLGLMGNPMAKNIHKAGFDLSVFNRDKNKTEEFQKLGVKVYDSIQEMAKDVDVVITMITGPKDVKEVAQELVKAAKKNLTMIDMSTIGPAAAKQVGELLKKADIDFVDAPVTGSVPRAITGELTIFIGANKQAFEKVKRVLESMGKNLQYIGETGSGQAVKLVNNHLVAATVSALAEAMLLGDNLKIERKKLAEALGETPSFSPFMKLKLPNFVTNTFPTAFSVANMHKDLQLALEEMKKAGKNLPILTMVENFFSKSKENKHDQEDISAVVKSMGK